MKITALLPLALSVVFAGTACSRIASGDVNSASVAQAGVQTVEINAEGLATGQRGLHHSNAVAFGQPQREVLMRLRSILGAPTNSGRNPECPSGPVDFVQYRDLQLNFEHGRFAGYLVDGRNPPIETYQGLSVGDRRSDIDGDADVTEQEGGMLGTELSVNGVGVLLDGPGAEARITTLFAGVTCFAR